MRTLPSHQLVTMFIVLFNPVPLSMNPNSFFVDNPLMASIIALQSFQTSN